MFHLRENAILIVSISMFIHYNLRPENFLQRTNFVGWAGRRVLAGPRSSAGQLGAWYPASSNQPVWVCVYTASGDQALLLSRKWQLLQEEKTEKKNVENNGEKPIFIFTGRILLLFCSASSVCKKDITLYIVSFLERSICEFTMRNP